MKTIQLTDDKIIKVLNNAMPEGDNVSKGLMPSGMAGGIFKNTVTLKYGESIDIKSGYAFIIASCSALGSCIQFTHIVGVLHEINKDGGAFILGNDFIDKVSIYIKSEYLSTIKNNMSRTITIGYVMLKSVSF